MAARAMAARLAVVIAMLSTLGASRAEAQEATSDTIVHRVRPGDTLDLLAAEYYGDRTRSVFLIVENKLPRARPLKPGERLRIPVSRELTTAPGDTLESVAAAYLGSARRGVFLADFNGVSSEVSLPAGTLLTIPFTIVHTAAAAESLADVARMYFGDGKNAELLRRYNFLERSALARNDTLIVPAYHVRLTAAKLPTLDAESRARRDHRRDAEARAARALPAARQAWKDGDFVGVKGTLTALDPDLDYLDSNEAIDVGVLLGSAQVACDEDDAALATFKRVIDRQSRATLRRYDYSPTILAVWQKAGGQIE